MSPNPVTYISVDAHVHMTVNSCHIYIDYVVICRNRFEYEPLFFGCVNIYIFACSNLVCFMKSYLFVMQSFKKDELFTQFKRSI